MSKQSTVARPASLTSNAVQIAAQGITIATDWRELSACRDSDPTLFFPIGSTGPAIDQISAAKQICGECAVQEDCLQYALESNQEAGVWGGYAEDERRRLRKRWLAERRRRAL
jgi:WhiB family transcriptional regulator, redox-sensing transcriptional regulator